MSSKYLAKGTYGCVFRPSFKCTDKSKSKNDDQNIVGKIFARETEVLDEWNESHVVKKLDPQGKLFLYPVDMCDVKIETILTDSSDMNVKKCPHIGKQFGTYHKQLLLKYGGISLTEFFYVIGESNQLLRRADVVSLMIPIFEGVKKLIDNDYVHQDIKMDNIVISESNREARLIDFGMLKHKDEFYTDENFLFSDSEVNYIINAPEYRFHHHEAQVKKQRDALIIKEHDNLKLHKTSTDKNKLSIQINDFINRICNMRLHDDVVQYLKKQKIHEKSDVYSLGLVIAASVRFCVREKEDAGADMMENLIEGMTHANPFERFDINESIELAMKIYSAREKIVSSPIKIKSPTHQTKPQKDCPPGQYRNPVSGRCKKVVPEKAIKKTPVKSIAAKDDKPKKECPRGQYRNPDTGRCKKIAIVVPKNTTPKLSVAKDAKPKKECPQGQYRNPDTGRCKKIVGVAAKKTPKLSVAKDAKPKKECPPGQYRNPDTGRCKKIAVA